MTALAAGGGAVLTGATASQAPADASQQGGAPADEAAPVAGTFEHVVERARELAQAPFAPADTSRVPEGLKALNHAQYQNIRFDPAQALWADRGRFSVQFHHLGFLYQRPVAVNEVVDGDVRPIQYRPEDFDFELDGGVAERLEKGLGFAGFRVHYPLNGPDRDDAVISFLGASYFRMVGREQSFGISARGLAIDTALPHGEEFPRFVEFWLVRPEPDDTTLTFFALLDSESLAGAYRFELDPNSGTTLDVDSRVFARRDVAKLGVAPLTSMFMWGENRVRHFDDHRPEVHDSDGLLQHTGRDEWIWRPLSNPVEARVSSLLDVDPRGFGLAQRDRRFRSYQDPDRHFGTRPSFWVSPRGDWGSGAVQLIEIPSAHESNDNIVAFWVPDQPLRAGEERRFAYTLRTFHAHRPAQKLATVQRTRIGRGVSARGENAPRNLRRFVVDYTGGPLAQMRDGQPVHARLSAAQGEAQNVSVRRLPDDSGWRVAFDLRPNGETPVDMRLSLWLHGHRLTETWNYVWDPKLIR